MTQKIRKAMVDQERLKTLAFREELARKRDRRRHDRVYYLSALIWALLAALPSLYVGRPIPYTVGAASNHDILSRVEFTWHDSIAEAQALRNLESAYARRYREEPLSVWAADTHGAIDQFLARAAVADSLSEVMESAAELGISATPEQLEAIWRGASVAKNDPYHYLVSPVKEILDNEIFPQGILTNDRFEIERGRTITIVRGDASHTAMVGGERGPVTAEQAGPILERRFRVALSSWIPRDFKDALREIIQKRLRPNLIYDEAGSRAGLEERREELLSRVQTVKLNDTLVARGSTVTLDKLAILREEERVFRESQGWRLPATRFTGNFLLFGAVAISFIVFFKTTDRHGLGTLRRFFATAVLCLLIVFIGYWLIWMGIPGTMLPVGLAVGIAAFGTNAWTAMFLAGITSLCGLILFEGRADLMIAHLAAALFFIQSAVRCRWRITLAIMSFLSGLLGALGYIAWNFARGDLQSLLSMSGWSQALVDSRSSLVAAGGLLANWLPCGIIMLFIMPLVERYFNVTTRIHLQDLTAQEHPLLRRLIIEAPGTYHHSSLVSTLAEAAATAIGADGLRARIGGLFHDVGKLLKPEYFTENEFGVSRHESMNPNMSALLIINHVRDGAEMARTFGLPNAVVDMILQHHGNGTMQYFYHKATQQAPQGAVVAREPFMYPGPRPQTPEAGVLMIADSVEAAVRSLDDPSPSHLRDLLARIIRARLIEGQFEESGLSMRQLAQVEEVLFRMLVSMYHTRVKYPGQEKNAGGRKR
ncbi:MAG: HDIG domain-containing protein [Planctomycetaceae bacterium]|nr:HDIG domain-containing protein [Planctomycetaceae bacterium]